AFRAKGWHGPGVLGPFGAAAAVGRLRRFDTETMAKAFGLAGSQAAGTFAAWGTPTVKFHQCRGALSGLLAALLAEQKFLATREKSTRSLEPLDLRSARQAAAVEGQVRRADFRSLHGGDHPARPGAHARPVRARALRRSEDAARGRRADRDTARYGAQRRAGG